MKQLATFLLLISALCGSCQTTTSQITLSDDAVLQLTEQVLQKVWPAYYLEDRTTLSMKVSGMTARLPDTVMGFEVIPYLDQPPEMHDAEGWKAWSRRSLDLRFLSLDKDELWIQVYTREALGAGVADVQFTKTADGWIYTQITNQVEYL